MKKTDVVLIIGLLAINTVFLFSLFSNETATTANVYYQNEQVMVVDLTVDGVYSVEGTNGEVEFTVKDGKVAITKETSPRNICSKQGYVNVATVPLVCLPNEVVIKSDSREVDGVAQ